MDLEKTLAELRRDLGHKPLSAAWAKVEIFLGLLGAGVGVLLLNWWAALPPAANPPWGLAAAGLGLFVLGGYLALAGHRSHLYQSSNKLTAYLVAEIRRLQDKG
jgi:hypothetical protein